MTSAAALDIPHEVRLELALASRILAKQNVVDAFGHVSCRHPAAPTQYFLMSSNKAPASVLPTDIQVYAINDATPLNKDGPRGFIERYLHSEIYKKFTPQDVGAVVHAHALEFIPFGIAHVLPFKAAYHMASFLGSHPAPIFDLEHIVGDHNDLLIRDIKSGAALAKSFDRGVQQPKKGIFKKKPPHVSQARPLVLMRGHGATLTAENVKLAVMRAIYARDNAKVLMNLHSLLGGIPGLMTQPFEHQGVVMLGETEAELSAASNGSQVDRAWNLWAADVIEGIPGAGSATDMQRRNTRQSYETTSYEGAGGRESFEGPQTSRSYTQSPNSFANLSSYPPQGEGQGVQRQVSLARSTQTQQQQQQPQLTHAQHVDAILNRSAPLDGGNDLSRAPNSTASPIGGFGGGDLSRGSTLNQRDYAGQSHPHSSAAAEPGAAIVGASSIGNGGQQGGNATSLERGPSMLSTGTTGGGSIISHSQVCPHCSKQLA